MRLKTLIPGLYIGLCLILCCTGCAVQRPKMLALTPIAFANPKATSFEVRGKVSLSDGKRHAQISLRWQQTGEHYVIYLYGPLGSGAVRLSYSQQSPIEYQDARGEVRSYGSAEALLEKETGWQLPISGLSWWLRGLPRPDNTHAPKSKQASKKTAKALLILRNQEGLITRIEQDGWIIEYLAYQSIRDRSYPHKIRLSRDKLVLKFVLAPFSGVAKR